MFCTKVIILSYMFEGQLFLLKRGPIFIVTLRKSFWNFYFKSARLISLTLSLSLSLCLDKFPHGYFNRLPSKKQYHRKSVTVDSDNLLFVERHPFSGKQQRFCYQCLFKFDTMSTLLEAIWDRRDVRVDDWPLMSSPLPTLLLCSAYFYIVKIWGPQFMRDRKPYELKNTLIIYNIIQVRSKCQRNGRIVNGTKNV